MRRGVVNSLVIIALAIASWAFVIGGTLLLLQILTFDDVSNTLTEMFFL
jgi:hypothetical protein